MRCDSTRLHKQEANQVSRDFKRYIGSRSPIDSKGQAFAGIENNDSKQMTEGKAQTDKSKVLLTLIM